MHKQTSTLAAPGAVPPAIDFSAIGASGLCILHCLGLPVLASALPAAGVVAEAEWVHQGLVLIAIPLSAYAIIKMGVQYCDRRILALAAFGFALLIASAFIERFHEFEEPMTVAGAISVAGSHIWRWRRHSKNRDDHHAA